MADLALVRDRCRREEAARQAAEDTADSAGRVAITGAAKSALKPSAKSAPTGPQTVPAAAMLLREAARLPPLADYENFDRVAALSMAALKRQLGERYSPQAAALEKFCVYDTTGAQVAALARMREFLREMEIVLRQTRGLVLYGSVGTGKDHLLAAALYHVASAGIPAAWVSGEDIYLRVRDSMDSHEREEKILQPWLQPTVLGISDPVSPRGDLGDWDARVLGRLLDRRYRALRPTWLTMNAIDEADAKAKLTALIWDRFQEDAEIIHCYWPSFRGWARKNNQAVAGKIGAAS